MRFPALAGIGNKYSKVRNETISFVCYGLGVDGAICGQPTWRYGRSGALPEWTMSFGGDPEIGSRSDCEQPCR